MNGYPGFVSPAVFDGDMSRQLAPRFDVRGETTVEECELVWQRQVEQAAYCDAGIANGCDGQWWVLRELLDIRKTLDVERSVPIVD